MAKNHAGKATAPRKRLVLCFDGTWNTPESETNVSRIYAAIADRHSGCDQQLKFYDAGVGTTWGSRIAGGVLGWGLNQNILEGYCWLVDNYHAPPAQTKPIVDPNDPAKEKFEDGDQIFLFGFSRGAFTARSLAGLVNACGLLKKEPDGGRTAIDSPLVQEAWKLYSDRSKQAEARGRDEDARTTFRQQRAHNVKIRFIGVWDTVGALGVPSFGGSMLPTRELGYGFHDASLCRIVEYAYHAVAIDEHRRDYAVALWSAEHPIGTREVEQRWFPGAHSNVGGGYQDDLLPELSLHWIAERACAHGLKFALGAKRQGEDLVESAADKRCKQELRDFQLDGIELMAPIRDSFKEFMFGLYRIGSIARTMGESAWGGLKRIRGAFGLRRKSTGDSAAEVIGETGIDGRYYRPMLVSRVNEIIDSSAQTKWARDPRYRPRNLAFAGRESGGAERHAGAPHVANGLKG